jgi:hypothetical protein
MASKIATVACHLFVRLSLLRLQDFALPLLVLHAIHWKTAINLRDWMQICPHRQITVLDTHDG